MDKTTLRLAFEMSRKKQKTRVQPRKRNKKASKLAMSH